jgi:RHS repeat-associated protein
MIDANPLFLCIPPSAPKQGKCSGQRASYSTARAGLRGARLYCYDSENRLLTKSDGTVALIREYVHPDHLATPQKMTDAAQQVVWDAQLRPFGEADAIAGTATNDQRFPGQLFDAESGLHYNYFRDYDPSTGRYLQSDPIGLAGGLNTYAYVYDNPLIYIDSLGLAVGDWWDFPSNLERAREIAREELARRPRSHNDMDDAMRHAEWMRRTTQETNACSAWLAGTGHELDGLLNGQPWEETIMDLHNNAVGRNAGSNSTPVNPGKLWSLPNNGSNYNSYQGVR